MKKYYVMINDEGKEVSRKLTTHHEEEDFESMTTVELSEVYYETSAEFGSKARKISLLENLLLKRQYSEDYFELSDSELAEIDRNILNASNNIIDAIEGE